MDEEMAMMVRQDPARVGQLILRTGIALGMHHAELATYLGRSRRTVSRWGKDGTRLDRKSVVTLAELAYRRDEPLAEELAGLIGETLVSLGIEAAPAPPATSVPSPVSAAVPARKLADAVVCAAAEALDTSPRLVRPALLAALRSAREAGLSAETLEALLAAHGA